MTKMPFVLLLTVALVSNLFAQSEAQKSKPLGSATPTTAQVHDGSKLPADKVPPPQTGGEQSSTDSSAKPQVDKNPPPLDLKNMDTSVKPSEDFYQYANGTWIKNNPVPPEFSRWGSFNELTEKNNDALHEIAEKAAADAAKLGSRDKVEQAASSEIQKVGDYYASGRCCSPIIAVASKACWSPEMPLRLSRTRVPPPSQPAINSLLRRRLPQPSVTSRQLRSPSRMNSQPQPLQFLHLRRKKLPMRSNRR